MKTVKKIIILENDDNNFDIALQFIDNTIKTFYFNADIRTANGIKEGFELGIKYAKGELELL